MMTHKMVLLLGVVMSLGCNSFAAKPAPTSLSQDAKLVAVGNNCFALQLYEKLRDQPGNLFFSPYSISTALAMTYAGAKGRTQEQMAQTLCFPTSKDIVQKLAESREPLSPDGFARAFGEIVRDLNTRGGQGKYELRVANALWGQQDYEFLASFVQVGREPVRRPPGAGQFREGRRAGPADHQCLGREADQRQDQGPHRPGRARRMTRLVLTNAVYFKGNWATQFKKDQTRDEPFTLLDGSKVQVPMMNQKATFGYAETDGLQVLEMPYVGQELSMVILLPKDAAGLSALEKSLTAQNLSKWLTGIRRQEVIVAVPKFKMTQKFAMKAVLQSMGMTEAFSLTGGFLRHDRPARPVPLGRDPPGLRGRERGRHRGGRRHGGHDAS